MCILWKLYTGLLDCLFGMVWGILGIHRYSDCLGMVCIARVYNLISKDSRGPLDCSNLSHCYTWLLCVSLRAIIQHKIVFGTIAK